MTWDDDRKVAAFVTPADSALRNYSSFIRQASKEETLPTFNQPLQLAMQVFQALGEIGCLYQADPALPFTKVQGNPMVVDSISLPRDTLKRITGDCDDLTVLYCSLLETAGTETGFITVPEHIFSVFNTKVPGRDYARLHPDRGMTINLEGELWVPVEITLIGKTGFLEAWRKGIEEWTAHEASPEKRGFFSTRQCQQQYRPVGLKETDLGLQYGRPENILNGFRRDMDKLVEALTEEARSAVRTKGRKEDYNRLGILYSQLGRYAPAEGAFQSALKADSGYLNARINLASLLFLKKDYPASLAQYQSVLSALEQQKGVPDRRVKVLLNLSRVYYQLEKYEEAKRFYGQAEALDPQAVAQYAYLGKSTGEQTRAEGVQDASRDLLFVED